MDTASDASIGLFVLSGDAYCGPSSDAHPVEGVIRYPVGRSQWGG